MTPNRKSEQLDLAAIRAQARRAPKAALLAEPRRARRDRRFRGIPVSRISAAGLGVGRRRAGPPQVSEADGRVTGAGRPERLHAAAERNHHALRARSPRTLFPGKPLFFATAMPLSGRRHRAAGREPHGPAHQDRRQSRASGQPWRYRRVSRKPRCCRLYDPDRSQTITHLRRITLLERVSRRIRGRRSPIRKRNKGAGLRILTETVTSPSLAAQLRALLKDFPAAKWHQYEPAGAQAARAGARLAFGEPVNTYYRVENAKVILSLDSDFLTLGPGQRALCARISPRRASGSER